jgi:hypothetical protein
MCWQAWLSRAWTRYEHGRVIGHWSRRRPLDITVTETKPGKEWSLTDLLGRAMGRIACSGFGTYIIYPDGLAVDIRCRTAGNRETHAGRLPPATQG